ncbi:hypothetical protein [Siphonobacter aquaeclarae]|uniref:Uncharacterized protein n=1 Tax=Siphonobacter aquaeclarae TaxID=563176 RepID=A0A1G9IYA6_9BACT|nr:hypothetical protein [Siphonobacter aquaeclarae]SDL30249.1 hypothetical protein SAMN04488090_0674 [Siphonobacter aquaeclarae]
MKNRLFSRLVLAVTACAVAGAAVLTMSFRPAGLIEDLGISESQARSQIWDNFNRQSFYVTAFRSLKGIAGGSRASVAKAYCAYIRTYVESDDFRQRYEKYRLSMRPTGTPQTMPEETKKELRKIYTETIQQYRESLKTAPANLKGVYQKGLSDTQKLLTELDDPNPDLTRWKKEYPESANAPLKAYLEKFLSETKDIDFKAALKSAPGGKMKFVNPTYETRPSYWKMCFRAGPEATAAVRQYVTEWHATLR